MRDPEKPVAPGELLTARLTLGPDEQLPAGTPVIATDGLLGPLRERRVGEGPEGAYLGVDTAEGLLYVPERLVRERRADGVYLSLPAADVKANSSHDTLPVQPDPTHLPTEPR